jgi:CRISPR-associated protein Cas2
MRFLIAYDIKNTKIRGKISRILEEFGERVQFSVFEFDLNKNQYSNLLARLESASLLKNTSGCKIYFYTVDPHLDRSIKRIGQKPVIDSNIIIV